MKKTLALVGLAALMVPSYATILASDNFDSYTVGGELYDQGSWNFFGDSDFLIANNPAGSGNSVHASFAAAPSSRWNWIDLGFDPSASAEKVVIGSVDIYLDSSVSDMFYMGLDAYTPSVSRIAAARIRRDTGAVELLQSTVVGTSTAVATMDAWNNLKLVLDYNSLTASVWLNGSDTGLSSSITAGQLGDIDLYAVRSGGAVSGYFDNYQVETVPEPATMAALGLGAAAMLRRKRK